MFAVAFLTAHGQTVTCPVISTTGFADAEEAITVVGQLAVGFVTDGAIELENGAVPCWTAPRIDEKTVPTGAAEHSPTGAKQGASPLPAP
jgi:hypothetical protein